jgi:4-amino-4-deoxy-L-arabinose transferase-like glycosyltransferase
MEVSMSDNKPLQVNDVAETANNIIHPHPILSSFGQCLLKTIQDKLRKRSVKLVILLAIGFFTRFAMGLASLREFPPFYADIARNLISGNGYSIDGLHPTAFRTPIYPLYLSLIMLISGQSLSGLIIAHAAIGSVNALLCSYLAKTIFGPTSGIVAYILYLLIPYLAWMELQTEGGLVTLGLLISLLSFILYSRDPKYRWIILAGIALAFAYLVRPSVLFTVLFLAACFSLTTIRRAGAVRAMLIGTTVVSVWMAGIVPWGVRNYLVFHRFYLGQTNQWQNIWKGSHQDTWLLYPQHSLDNLDEIAQFQEVLDEFEAEDWFKSQALLQLKNSNLVNVIIDSIRKLCYLFDFRLVPRTKRILIEGQVVDIERGLSENIFFSVPYILMIVSSIIGLLSYRRMRTQVALFTFFYLLSFSLPYMLTFSYSRYTTQVYFLFLTGSARGLASLANNRCMVRVYENLIRTIKLAVSSR